VTGLVVGTVPGGGVAVLVNATDPDDAAFGWFITAAGAGGAQTLHAYARAARFCSAAPLPPAQRIPGFALCPGLPASLFPSFGAAYPLGGSAVVANAYYQAPSGSRASFLSAADGCAPVSLLSAGTPFDVGAWSLDVEAGSAAPPPARYFQMPSYCARQ